MFLDRINDRQKQSFLALATRMMMADGEVAPEEEALLNDRKAAMGGEIVAPAAEIFGATNSEVIDTREARVFVTFELLVLMVSDDSVHIDESSVLDEICSALEISDDDRATLQDLAVRANQNPDDGAVKDGVEALAGG